MAFVVREEPLQEGEIPSSMRGKRFEWHPQREEELERADEMAPEANANETEGSFSFFLPFRRRRGVPCAPLRPVSEGWGRLKPNTLIYFHQSEKGREKAS